MTRAASFLTGLFYFCVVVAGVLLLAAAQLRSSSGSRYDTWSVNYDSNQFLGFSLKYQRDQALQKQVDAQKGLSFTEQCLKLYDQSGTLKDAQVVAALKAAKDANKGWNDVDGAVQCAMRGYILLLYDQSQQTSDLTLAKSQLADLDEQLKQNSYQATDLVKDHQDFLALKGMEKQWHTWLFVVVPYDLLILLLVMSMGALGGLVRLLRDYGDEAREDPVSRDYIFVPLIGLVVAVGGYILAKTGLLLLASTKDEASLSPFMIGLVGIVSGLLAKEVIDRIAGAGRKILSTPEKRDPPPQQVGQQAT